MHTFKDKRIIELEARVKDLEKTLRLCMGWNLRCIELETFAGMKQAQEEDLASAEICLSEE